MTISRYLPILLLSSASAQQAPTHNIQQQQNADPLRRHRLQQRKKKTTRQLASSLNTLADTNVLLEELVLLNEKASRQADTITTTVGNCNGDSPPDVYAIGSTLSICIATTDSANIISSLKTVTATSTNGIAEELVDGVGDANLATTVEGIGSAAVTIETLITLGYYYDAIGEGMAPILAVEGTAVVEGVEVAFAMEVPFGQYFCASWTTFS